MRLLKIACILPVLIVSFSASLLAVAEQPVVLLPEGALTAVQIEGLFQGRTAVAKVADKELVEIYYFAEDGSVIEARKGFQKSGKWSVRDDGRLCIDLKGDDRDCRMIIKEGGNFNQYAVKLDGNHRYEKSYTDFHDGDQLRKLSSQPLLPLGTLDDEEVVELFSGQTVESVTARKSRVSHTYYDPDGTVEQVRNGVKRYGKWRVTKNARICLQMEDLGEKCRIIVKEAGEYKKYIVKKNGHHQHSVSYRKFSSGKRF